jgi:hypothetical protein
VCCLTSVTNHIQFEMNAGRVFLILLLATQVTAQDVCANKVASLPVSALCCGVRFVCVSNESACVCSVQPASNDFGVFQT